MSDTGGRPDELGPDESALPPERTATATFGMGCFWGPDARFGALPGVVRTRVGYAGGTKRNPQYHSLGDHTEVVQIEYDPDRLTYRDLLGVFWANHSPTAASKRQYRSLVLVHDGTQQELADRSVVATEDRLGRSVETAVEPLDRFTLAEEYHQKYELRSTPVLGDELVDIYGDDLVDSTVAARLNGFVAGHGNEETKRAVLAGLSLPPSVLSEVQRRL